jgi:death on curing protein
VKGVCWLTAEAVIAIHRELIAGYGGIPGLRASATLESAIARPKQIAAYNPRATVPGLAAAYAWGLLRNHPFVDGNKRVALAAINVFLELNGWELICSETEETAKVLQAAAGEITEGEWNTWVRRSARRILNRSKGCT